MFNEKTVFILGAGASAHYGYPTGEKLIPEVISKAKSIFNAIEQHRNRPSMYYHPSDIPNWILENYTENNSLQLIRAQKDLEKFIERITHINPLVIDYFLGNNADLRNIGKFLISCVILDYEYQDLKHNKQFHGEDWYKFIIHEMLNGCKNIDELISNDITFITFNYDVSLERNLFSRLSVVDLFKNQEDKDKISKFLTENILHVYGDVANYFETQIDISKFRGFDANSFNDLKPILDLANITKDNLWVIEECNNEEESEKMKSSKKEIKSRVQNAKNIYILGYGFDTYNNNRIGLNEYFSEVKSQRVCFTNYKDKNKINKKVSNLFFGNYSSFLSHEKPLKFNKESGSWVEKSINKVYDALANDFEFFGNE